MASPRAPFRSAAVLAIVATLGHCAAGMKFWWHSPAPAPAGAAPAGVSALTLAKTEAAPQPQLRHSSSDLEVVQASGARAAIPEDANAMPTSFAAIRSTLDADQEDPANVGAGPAFSAAGEDASVDMLARR